MGQRQVFEVSAAVASGAGASDVDASVGTVASLH